MVRNFYLSGDIDGRNTVLSGGPACKDGGMELTITQRDDGEIIKALVINCYENNGELITKVIDGRTSETLAEIKTKR